MTLILGIETSCDETSAAVVRAGRQMLSNVVSSQVDLHAQYGGIYPEVASRAHIERIYPVIEEGLRQAGVTLQEVEAVAVTAGPGLPGSLAVGLNAAKGLALGSGRPLIGVNHLEGHIYAVWLMEDAPPVEFPVVVLIVSGGHTDLLLMTAHRRYERLGGTRDDAAGEAFDKVGRLLGLPYPGGPSIQQAAAAGSPTAFDFPRAELRGPQGEGSYDFSFSGLKTAVLRTLQALQPGYKTDDPLGEAVPVADLAASFQAAAVDVLVSKCVGAAQQFGGREIFVVGGVGANAALRQALVERSPVPVRVPPLRLCTDNAAMIAAAAYYQLQAGDVAGLGIDLRPRWPLG